MELLQLRYFRIVAKLEHMSRAAEELHIAQPALSITISRLEENIGVPLFDRIGGRIRLNSFGKLFLDKVEKALNLLDEGQKEITELAGLDQGSIHLATQTLELISEPLRQFLSIHPHVQMQISQASIEEMTRMLELGEVDLCFSALPIEVPGFVRRTVMNEQLYLAVPQHHRLADREHISLAELEGEPMIGYKQGDLFQNINEAFFQEIGITPRYVCRVDDPATVISLVRTGIGLALYGCKSGDMPQVKLIPVSYPVCQRSFFIMWSEQRYVSLAARKFTDFLIDYFHVNK